MKVAEYAEMMGMSRQGVYYRIHNGLLPFYTKCGHFYVDETEIDWEEIQRSCDLAFIEYLMKDTGFNHG